MLFDSEQDLFLLSLYDPLGFDHRFSCALDLHYLQTRIIVPLKTPDFYPNFLFAKHFYRLDQLAKLPLDSRSWWKYKVPSDSINRLHHCFQYILCWSLCVSFKRMGNHEAKLFTRRALKSFDDCSPILLDLLCLLHCARLLISKVHYFNGACLHASLDHLLNLLKHQ